MGAANLLPLVAWRRADLAGARGDGAERTRRLREAHATFVERGLRGHAEALERELRSSNGA
jgi:hypothetical protein